MTTTTQQHPAAVTAEKEAAANIMRAAIKVAVGPGGDSYDREVGISEAWRVYRQECLLIDLRASEAGLEVAS